MLFKDFALKLDAIESVSSRLEITALLAMMFKELTVEEMKIMPYLLQGRIGPLYSSAEFGMAEKSVVKAVASILQLDPSDFSRLVRDTGDLGRAVEKARDEFISLQPPRSHTIREVYDVFVRITEATGNGSQETKAQLLASILDAESGLSCRYIARIPLGQMRLGLSEITILDALSWMISGTKEYRPRIEKAYQVRPDLGLICAQVKEDGIEHIEDIVPAPFTPILMMKAHRLSSGAEIIEKIGTCALEPKYDGLRLQIHIDKKGKRVAIYTRGLENATTMYADVVINILQSFKGKNAIVEGEALGYDPKTGRPVPFQETMQRKRKHDIASKSLEIPLRVNLFDLLYIDGKSIIDQPYTSRRESLDEHFIPTDTVLISPREIVDDAAVIERVFDQYITDGLEGIMAKKLDAPYMPGAREYAWVKLKRSYSAKVNDTIDCVILGYDLGKGKRAVFGIGAVLVGIYDAEKESYVTLAKIGTGMTDDEWRKLKALAESHAVKEKPKEYEVNKIMEPDVWVTPHMVLEIRCDELTESKIHTSGWGMRFPRLERFRTDKKPEQTTSVAELAEIRAQHNSS